MGHEDACLVLEEAAEALLEDVIANLRINLRVSKKRSSLKQQGTEKTKGSKAQRKDL